MHPTPTGFCQETEGFLIAIRGTGVLYNSILCESKIIGYGIQMDLLICLSNHESIMELPMRWLMFAVLVFSFSLPVQGYEVIEVKNGGEVKGKIRYTGKTVNPRKVIVSKDQETCGHDPREVPRVEISEDQGLLGATVLIEKIEKGKDFKPREEEPVIDQKECHFIHHGTRILRVGEKFKVRNSDPVLHNIHAKQNKISIFNQGQPFQGMEFENQFEETGPVIINCDAHSWMWAFLYVTDHPYVTNTDDEGKFEIEDIPAGTYTLKVWHPYLGIQTREIVVEEDEEIEADFEYTKRIRSRG